MTEEIIVNGVDVAECEYYIQDYQRANNIEGRYEHCKDVCELNGDNYFYCKMNKNCYYKQLKRLEQERDEWKKKYEDVANENLKEIYELIKKNDCWKGVVNVVCSKLEQENKELKEKVEVLDKMTGIFSARLCDTYRSALEDILESAKFAQCLPCGSGNLEDCLNCNDDTTNNGQFCMEKRIHDIKTKCVEVLNENKSN